MADFERALKRTLGYEGGYDDDPDDPGGKTRWGITEAEARASGYAGEMRDYPLYLAKEIYRTRYWNKIRGDELPDQDLAEELFDSAVNCGIKTAITWLQQAMNAMNKNGKLYADVIEDGILGPQTLSILVVSLSVAPWYKLILTRALDCQQGAYYLSIARSKPRFEKFVPGWYRLRVGVKD